MTNPMDILWLFSVNFIVLQSADAIQHGRNLIWAQVPSHRYVVSRLMGIEGDPNTWVKSGRIQVRLISAPTYGWQFKALAYDYASETLLWSESTNKRIQSLILNGSTETRDVFKGTSPEVNGMAVDWVSHNLYWADSLYDWIIMAPIRQKSDVRCYKILIQEGLDNPHGIAVHPDIGLFWTDWGERPRIEMADLLGDNRQILAEKNVLHPRDLAVDATSGRVYWVDSVQDTVESVLISGQDRRVLVQKPGYNFFGIALSEKYIFVTDQSKGHLQIFDRNGTSHVDYRLQSIPYDIVMYDEENQQLSNNTRECDLLGCDQICVRDSSGASCLCGEGYNTTDDGVTCTQTKSFVLPLHVYAINDAICQYPANIADMSLTNVTLDSQCFLDSRNGYLALTFDAKAKMLYYSENNTKTISRIVLEAGARAETITGGTGVVQGMALDWTAGNLYWTDSTNGLIKMSRADGSFPKVVVEDLDTPLGIAVHPGRGKIYWTVTSELDEEPKVEMANLDGSQREVISDTYVDKPSHLYIDFQKDILYWTDSTRFTVMKYDLNTSVVSTYYSKTNISFFGLSVYKDFLLWTDTGDRNGIHIANMKKKEKVRGIIHPAYGIATDLVTIASFNQPEFDTNCMDGKHDCQQLCVSGSDNTFWCQCGFGYRLSDDLKTCTTDNVNGNWLLVTDAYQRQIYQVGAATKAVHAIDVKVRHQPIAVDYDVTYDRVYWTDNTAHVIKSVKINGQDEQVVLGLSEKSVSDGISIDYLHSLLYYTDTGLDIIGVISLRNYSMHKVILETGMEQPRDIVVLPKQGIMFWTDWGSEAKIETARMDGSDRKVFLNLERYSWPNGLAVDTEEGKLYWTEANHNRIEVINLDGTQKRTLIQQDVAHYFGIALMGDFIYVTDWKRPYITRMHKHGGTLQQFGPSAFTKLYGIHAFNLTERVKGSNLCLTSNCEHLCVPRSNMTVVCLCSEGYTLNNDAKTCRKVVSTSVSPSPTSTIKVTSQKQSMTSSLTTTGAPTTSASSRTVTQKTNTVMSTTQSTTIKSSSSGIPTGSMTTVNETAATSTMGTSILIPKTTTEAKIPDAKPLGMSRAAAVGISVTVVVVVVALLIAGVFAYRKYRSYRIPHGLLVEENRSEPFYRIAFVDKEETAFDSGIENPTYDYMPEDNEQGQPLRRN